jgi:GT2 family glycosyltransferase
MRSGELVPAAHPVTGTEQHPELSIATPKGHQSDLPLVSVIILNYKRREALARTIDSALRQDYPHREIIVVDNHSEEDIRSVVEAKDPGIKLIELSQNLGSCAGRNAGIREARGQILVTLDNDVTLFSPSELTYVANAFEERPDVHVLVFQICDPGTGQMRLWEWCHPKYWKEFSQSEFETYFLPEGASAFRREIFEVAGLYYEPFFIYHEGGDLALRLIDRGFRILYCPRVRVAHLQLREARPSGRSYYFHTRNWIWFAYKDFPIHQGIWFLLPKIGMMLFFTIRSGSYRHFVRGLWDGVKGLKRIKPDRTPISKRTIRYVAELNKGRPNWRLRFARHHSQPQV